MSLNSAQRQQFNLAVREFKTKHNIKLKILFELKNYDSAQLRKEFWSKYEICNYLSRSHESINFSEYHPIFETDRQNKLNNDYYESRVYQLAFKQNWRILPFRDNVLSDNFYLEELPIDFWMMTFL